MICDPTFRRRPSVPDDLTLNWVAIRWLAQLPDFVRPIALIRWFPRIVNTLAIKWGDPKECRRYLTSLQIDERGTRHGFPMEILEEICTLSDYFDALYPPPKDIWQQADGH